jgi:hypothetical protein
MQGQHLLLLECLDRYRLDVGAAHGFYKSGCIGPVGLVGFDIGSHVLRRTQSRFVSASTDAPRPVVRAPVRLHDHAARSPVHKKRRKPGPVQALTLTDTPVRAGYRELENVLCQINRDSRRVHLVHSFW